MYNKVCIKTKLPFLLVNYLIVMHLCPMQQQNRQITIYIYIYIYIYIFLALLSIYMGRASIGGVYFVYIVMHLCPMQQQNRQITIYIYIYIHIPGSSVHKYGSGKYRRSIFHDLPREKLFAIQLSNKHWYQLFGKELWSFREGTFILL